MKVDNIFSLFMFYVTFITVFPLLRIPGANMTFLKEPSTVFTSIA